MDLNTEIIQIKEYLFELEMIRPHSIPVDTMINRCVNMLYYLDTINHQNHDNNLLDHIGGLLASCKEVLSKR